MILATALVCLVVGISDGDTLTVRCPTGDAAHPYSHVKVRLAEMNAYWPMLTEALEQLKSGKDEGNDS